MPRLLILLAITLPLGGCEQTQETLSSLREDDSSITLSTDHADHSSLSCERLRMLRARQRALQRDPSRHSASGSALMIDGELVNAQKLERVTALCKRDARAGE